MAAISSLPTGASGDLAWQGSLLGGRAPGIDPGLAGVRRLELGEGAWIEHLPGWVIGADQLFATALHVLTWRQHTERIRGQDVLAPRLTCSLPIGELPDELAVVRDAAATLSARYGVAFARVGANLYRDGRDSVAWHGDRIARDRPSATIAIVSLGEPRSFRFKPASGGDSHRLDLGRGDLLVMGGSFQRTWRHAVPKAASAGPRISVTFRHAYPPRSVG